MYTGKTKGHSLSKSPAARLLYAAMLAAVILLPRAGRSQEKADSLFSRTGISKAFNPSAWLHQGENILMNAESRLYSGLDTGFLELSFPLLMKDFELTQNNFRSHGHHMRIRDLDDVKSRLLQQRADLEKWRNHVRKLNDSISVGFIAVEALIKDSIHTYIRKDSALWSIYAADFLASDSMLRKTDKQYQESLSRTVALENNLNRSVYQVNQLIMAVDKELRQRNAALYTRTHPTFWKLRSDTYPEGIGAVFMKTVRQNLDSLEFYGKNAYIRAILFRLLLLLITMLPIWYFRKNKDRFSKTDANSPYKFVHKYTGASASSFVMVMAPFIFINAPHVFIEAILATLAVTTSIIFIKENPGVGKRNMYALLAIYIILKVMNLMVSVTLFGRIVWTLSIVGLVPLYALFRNIHQSNIKYFGLYRLIIVLTALLYISGWVLNFTGHYPLGRILLLAGLDQFFLAIILYVAIFSFIDFIGILADIYNSSNHNTTVRVELIYRKLLTLVRILAIIFWFWSFILNINADDFLREHLSGILNQKIYIGSYAISPASIFIFFIVVYLAFYLSGLLDGLFYDEKRTSESTSKTSLGSIVLMLRLFIISLGFIIGMIIAGIPLNSVSLFFGALGVGIGFGLQGLIANLISGIIIAFEKPVYVGDIIEVDGQRGRVTDIGLRATKVDTSDGAEYVIPNGELTSRTMKNWTLTSKNYKLENIIQVDLKNDAGKVAELLEESLRDVKGVIHLPPPMIRLKEITPSSLKFKVSCWLGDIGMANLVQHELLQKIHQKLDESGISYPRKKDGEDAS
jgi:small-conductance mechanosensitive channel